MVVSAEFSRSLCLFSPFSTRVAWSGPTFLAVFDELLAPVCVSSFDELPASAFASSCLGRPTVLIALVLPPSKSLSLLLGAKLSPAATLRFLSHWITVNPTRPNTKREDAANVVKSRMGRATKREAPTRAMVNRDAVRTASRMVATNEVMNTVRAKAKKLRTGMPLNAT